MVILFCFVNVIYTDYLWKGSIIQIDRSSYTPILRGAIYKGCRSDF